MNALEDPRALVLTAPLSPYLQTGAGGGKSDTGTGSALVNALEDLLTVLVTQCSDGQLLARVTVTYLTSRE